MIPELPQEVSPDGREIWDWAGKLSRQIHLTDEARKLREGIHSAENHCGSCDLWMTRQCPREVHDNQRGHSRGPSMNAMKCSQFQMKSWDAKRLEGLKEELAKIESELNPK